MTPFWEKVINCVMLISVVGGGIFIWDKIEITKELIISMIVFMVIFALLTKPISINKHSK